MLDVLKSLGPIDLRNVRRDSLLAWIIALPLFMALLLRVCVLPLTTVLWERLQFDLTVYYPLILSYFIIMMFPATYGMVIGFLLLDERDDETLTALQVTPMPMNAYLAYRVSIPALLTLLIMFPAFPIAGLGNPSAGDIFIAAITAAPLAPLCALTLAGFSANKVQGFAVLKAVGFIALATVLFSYFVRSGWQWAFGIIPTFWPMKVYWALGESDPHVWRYVVIGLAYQFVLLALLLRRFNKVIHR
ncbi:MAG: hypothetical protein JXB35_07760 [Anaerolineae bacterium]|nr:hypothetical protein [Anaerolineae bacterium]